MQASVCCSSLRAGHQGRLGQAGSDIRTADHHARIAFAALQTCQDGLQIRQHAVGRLVTIARILAQQVLNHFLQRPRHFDTMRAQFGNRRSHVFEEDLADRLAGEGRATRQALVQQDAGGIQVRRLGHIDVHGSRLLGRRVQRGPHGLAVGKHVGQHGVGQSDVDELGAHDRKPVVNDDVARFDVAVQHASDMKFTQRVKHADADRQRLTHLDRPAAQARLERHALDIRHHEIQVIPFGAMSSVPMSNSGGWSMLCNSHSWRHSCSRRMRVPCGTIALWSGLDDHRLVMFQIVGQQRLRAVAFLQDADRLVTTAEKLLGADRCTGKCHLRTVLRRCHIQGSAYHKGRIRMRIAQETLARREFR